MWLLMQKVISCNNWKSNFSYRIFWTCQSNLWNCFGILYSKYMPRHGRSWSQVMKTFILSNCNHIFFKNVPCSNYCKNIISGNTFGKTKKVRNWGSQHHNILTISWLIARRLSMMKAYFQQNMVSQYRCYKHNEDKDNYL